MAPCINFFCNSIKNIQAGGNKTRPSALNRGVELVLEEGPQRIYWQTQNERCGRKWYTGGGSRREKNTLLIEQLYSNILYISIKDAHCVSGLH